MQKKERFERATRRSLASWPARSAPPSGALATLCPTMELLLPLILMAFGAYWLKSRDERARRALLGQHLSPYQIEKLMETLTEGYLRALGENDPQRRAQVWNLLTTSEDKLCNQFNRFAIGFAGVDAHQTRVSTLPVALPYADKLFPAATFDVRQVFAIHAQGITQAAQNSQNRSPRDKAYTLSAELFLMQHTCHWFCKSRMVASARLQVRHKTAYAQVLAAVAPETRRAYAAAVGIIQTVP